MSLIAYTHRASATFAGKNGRIAIQSGPSGPRGPRFFRRSADTAVTCGSSRAATPTSAYPAFSRSAKRILFTKLVDHGGDVAGDVFVMRSDGSHQRNLTDNPAYDTSAELLARTACGSCSRAIGPATTSSSSCMRMGATSAASLMTRLDNDDPVFFPSGRKIAFEVFSGGNGDIFTMRLNGKHRHRLTHNSRFEYLPRRVAERREDRLQRGARQRRTGPVRDPRPTAHTGNV